ncbi:non-specific lipid transfer protein GPI-anchored 11-like [Ziziphus jujuba]|uniref:Non-specific lipid transfer protein GPI-anchored 11-like n=1 Tax=Ziziphus jujuba TaxID=326968 RepID=A0ABM3INT4_ZIZJJ|nr:non-specific lipid transfer protein GPI-anchored 11-like [Ziziphus jujuba]
MVMRLLILSSILTWVVVGSCVVHENEAEVHENEIEVHEDLQAPSMAPSKDCSVVIYDMADCVPYLSDGSKKTKPDHSCCSGFETVIETSADCICEALKKSGQMGIQLNLTRAIALPSACGVSASPLKNCHLPNVPPRSSPVNPPKPSPETAPPPKSPEPPSSSDTSAPTPSSGKGGGGKAAQAPAPSSAAHINGTPSLVVLAASFVVSVSIFILAFGHAH